MTFFRVRSKWFFRIALTGIIMVAISKLKEAQVCLFAIDIVQHRFQTAEHKRLTQNAKIGTQRVKHAHKTICCFVRQFFIIGLLGEGVVQNFIESLTNQLFRDDVLQLIGTVNVPLNGQARLDRSWNLNIIVAIDAQNIFNHITRTLNIHTIGRNFQTQPRCRFAQDFHIQRSHNVLDDVNRNILANEVVNILIIEVNEERLRQSRSLHVFDVHGNLSAGQFSNQHSSLLQGINLSVWINAALKTERSISAQTMTAGALTNPRGVEIGAF